MGVGKLNRFTTGLAIAAALFCGLIFGAVAHAQVTGATLSGTVTDPSGAVIAGAATVTANEYGNRRGSRYYLGLCRSLHDSELASRKLRSQSHSHRVLDSRAIEPGPWPSDKNNS